MVKKMSCGPQMGLVRFNCSCGTDEVVVASRLAGMTRMLGTSRFPGLRAQDSKTLLCRVLGRAQGLYCVGLWSFGNLGA